MRLLWQGFDGGAEARAALDAFFADVARRVRPVNESGHPLDESRHPSDEAVRP
jgi:hypothetical protein